MRSLACVALGAALAACSGSKGGPAPGQDGGAVTVTDLAFIRQSRGLQTTEPVGLRNLEVRVGESRTPVTRATRLDQSVCQTGCVLTPDRSRLVYVKGTTTLSLMSAPVVHLEPSFAQEVQLNEPDKPLVQPGFRLVPPDRVLFLQRETEGGVTDGGATPETYTLASAPVTGGALVKYRNGVFLPGSRFGASADGSKVLFGEILGAANQLNVYLWDTVSPNTAAPPIFRFMREGSAQFGDEEMALSPDGREVLLATQDQGSKVLAKVSTDGRTVTPTQIRIGPVECGAAGPGEICLIQSPLFYSLDGSKVFFLGGRQSGVSIINQLYSVNADLRSPPQALSSFATEVHSLAINRARTRVVWSTEAGNLKRNNALFMSEFNGGPLTGTPEKIVDDTGISFHFQEPRFLE
jgi:hypothetical protein